MQNSSKTARAHVRDLRGPGSHAHRHPSRSTSGNQCARDYDALQAGVHGMLRAVDPADLKLWAQKWRWYERNSLPWNRARIHYEFARRRAFCRWPRARQRAGDAARGPARARRARAARARRVADRAGAGADPHRRRHVPQPRRAGRGRRAGRDRRALHVRQRLLRHRRQPPLRRPRQAGAVAGLHVQGPDARRRQRLVRRQRRHHQRRDDRRALRDRRQLGRHDRPAAALDRRRRRPPGCSGRSSTRLRLSPCRA